MEAHQFGGPWTEEKLDALRAYLIGYAQALWSTPQLHGNQIIMVKDSPMETVWAGITRAETLDEKSVQVRQCLADATRNYDWSNVITVLSENPVGRLYTPQCTKPLMVVPRPRLS